MSNLTRKDLGAFKASFITPEIVERARLRRVDNAEGSAMVGRKTNANSSYAGIAFPYFSPSDPNTLRAYRLRRDSPDLERGANGVEKEKAKYLAPPGSKNLLYFPPDVSPECLADSSMPIVITEGEKKALALSRLATEDLTLNRWHFLPLAIAGVWNFRGVVGRTASANGNRVAVRGFLSDFELIALSGRRVSILFDANVHENEMVGKARDKLARELQERGAKVSFVDLPDVPGVNGIDDLLGTWEAEHGTGEAITRGLALINSGTDSVDTRTSGDTQSARIIRLIESSGAEFFHDSEGETFTTILINSHKENHKIKSKFFREWIGHEYWKAEGKVPSTKALQDALNAVAGRARFASPQEEVFVRLAESSGRIYLDLANEKWQVVEVTADRWRVIEGFDAPVKFRRPKGMLPLPIPEGGWMPADLRSWINVSEEHFPLVATWLLACYRSDKPFAVLILNGEQGSAKSTTSRVLRRIIDPNASELRTAPRDERDLIIAANNGWILAIDNMSKIPDWLSDALCRISTGAGFATRTLYENDEETMFSAKRPLILNGITELATRPDLLDRSLIVNCPNIAKNQRRDEETFWLEFERGRPRLLGSFLDALSQTLKELPHTKLTECERMADFDKLGVAAESALGFERGTFQRAYASNRRDAIEIAVESSTTATVVLAFMSERSTWDGTATRLLGELNDFVAQHKTLGIKPEELPKQANALSGELKKVSPNLRANGIEFKRAKSGSRTIILQNMRKSSSRSSESSRPRRENDVTSDDFMLQHDAKDDRMTSQSTTQMQQTQGLGELDDVDDDFHAFFRTPEFQERLAIMTVEGGLSEAEAKRQLSAQGSGSF